MSLTSRAEAFRDFSGPWGFGLETAARAQFMCPGGTGWLGIGTERRARPEYSSKSPILEVGTQMRHRDVALAARARHRTVLVPQPPTLVRRFEVPSDTLPHWEAGEPELASITSFEMAASWIHSPWSIEAGGGLGFGNRVAPIWLTRMQATRWLRQGMSVVLSATGGAPDWFSEDFADRARVRLGMVVEPGRPSTRVSGAGPPPSGPHDWRWDVVKLRGDVYALRARARGVDRMALRGDFTSWEPVSLGRAGLGWWEATIRMTPGLHYMEVSVNGGRWQPPAGLATTLGEYGGEVGTFVAE